MTTLLWLIFLASPQGAEPSIEETPPGDQPYLLVLGTAQDAGAPQLGCRGACCTTLRSDPDRRHHVVSLLLADPITRQRWLFEATPDLREQVELAEGHPPNRQLSGARPPLFEGLFLTHAHMGHYAGLLQLGPEAYSARELPAYVTPRMSAFLRDNAPWRLLVEREHLSLRELQPSPQPLTDSIRVRAVPVPHRDEFTDTVAFHIQGPGKSALFLPDIDKWERWSTPIEKWIQRVDYALLDGAFYEDGEIPGRSMAEIPHPFIEESLARFAKLPAELRDRVYFIHLNHTNPALDPDSAASREIAAAGMHVAREGDILPLGREATDGSGDRE